MQRNKKLILPILLLCLTLCFGMVACEQEIVISFVTGTDEAIDDINLTPEQIITGVKLPIPTREGWRFLGWCFDEQTNNLIQEVNGKAIFQSSATIYAKWQQIGYYTALFFDDEGNRISAQDFSEQDSITPPANTAKEGYNFVGWFTSLDGGQLVDNFDSIVIDPNAPNFDADNKTVSYYGRYIVNTYSFTMSSLGEVIDTKDIAYGETLGQLPVPDNNDTLAFVGWYADQQLESVFDLTTMPADNITVYAKWELQLDSFTIINQTSNPTFGDLVKLSTDLIKQSGISYQFLWSNQSATESIDIVLNSGNNSVSVEVTARYMVNGITFEQQSNATITVYISPLAVEVPQANTGLFVYNGNEQIYELDIDDNVYIISNNKHTDVGEYTVTVSLANDNYTWQDNRDEDPTYSFVIARQQVAIPTADTTQFVYSGVKQTYSLADNERYTITDNKKTNVGVYSATAQLNDTANYEWTDGSTGQLTYEWTIGKAALTITASSHTVRYGDNAPIYTVSYGGLVNGETASVLTTLPTLTSQYSTTTAVADSGMAVTASGADASNYTITYVGGTITINRQQVAIPTADSTQFVYNGAERTYVLTEDVRYTIAGNKKQTNAGQYDLTVQLNDTSNYEWADGTTEQLTYAFVIGKATLKLTGNKVSVEYGSSRVLLLSDFDCEGLVNNDKIGDALSNYNIASTRDINSIAGKYSYSLTATSSNYEIVNQDGVIEVTRKQLIIAYNGNTSVKALLGQTEFVLASSLSGLLSTDIANAYKLATTSVAVGEYILQGNMLNESFKWHTELVITNAQSQDVTNSYIIYYDLHAVIEQSSFLVHIDANNGIYGGNPQNLVTVTVEEDISYAVMYSVDNGTTWTADVPVGINAGTYYVLVKIVSNAEGFEDYLSTRITIVIKRQQVAKPTEDLTQFVYSGVEQTYSLADNERYTITDNKQTNAGEYTATVNLINANYEWVDGSTEQLTYAFVIARQQVAIPTADTTQFVYSGVEQTYSLADNERYTITDNKKTNAGTYTVTVNLINANYEWVDGATGQLTYEWTIGKAVLTITASSHTVIYGDNAPIYTVSYSGFVNGETASVLATLPSVTSLYSTTTSVADSGMAVTVSGAAASNYNITYIDGTITIYRQQVAIPTADTTTFVYSGVEHTYLLAQDGRYTIAGNKKTNAGTYNVTVDLISDNYEWADGSTGQLTYEFVIARQQVAIPTADATQFVYSGAEYTYALTEDVRYTIAGNKQTNAGEYSATAQLNDIANYEWADGSTGQLTYEFVIARQQVAIPTADATQFVYSGAEYTYALTEDVRYTIAGNKQTNAGAYTATVDLISDNYKWADGSTGQLTYEFVIARQQVAIPTADTTQFVYNGVEYTYVLAEDGRYTIAGNKQTNAGAYTAIVDLISDNYEWTDGSIRQLTYAFVINRQQVAIPTADTTQFVYSGAEYTYALTEDVRYTIAGNKQTNAGAYTAIVDLISDNYEWADDTTGQLTYEYVIEKADYIEIVVPLLESMKYNAGMTLADFALPANYRWSDGTHLITVLQGNYSAVYNADTVNYNDYTLTIAATVTLATVDGTATLGFVHNSNLTAADLLQSGLADIFTLNGEKLTNLSLTYYVDSNQSTVANVSNYQLTRGGSTYVIYAVVRGFGLEDTVVTVIVKAQTVLVGESYYTIEDALKVATSGNAVVSYNTSFAPADIAVIVGYTAVNGNYTVQSGVTLLVPFDKNNSTALNNRVNGGGPLVRNSAYSKLTMPENLHLTVDGHLLVNAQKTNYQTLYMGLVNGANYAEMEIHQDSTITVNGTISAMGFIYGQGEVIANDKALVNESMTLLGFKGGTITRALYDNMFPFNQYTISNLECKLTMYAGARMDAKSYIYMSMHVEVDAPMFGNSAKYALWIQNGYLVKEYNPDNMKSTVTAYGDLAFNNVTVQVGVEATTTGKELPFPANYDLVIGSGITTINNVGVKMLPGSSLTVKEGATLNIGDGGRLMTYGGNTTAVNNAGQYALGGWRDGNLNYGIGPIMVLRQQAYSSSANMGYYNYFNPSRVDIFGTLNISGTGVAGGTLTVLGAGTIVTGASIELKVNEQNGWDGTHQAIVAVINSLKIRYADGNVAVASPNTTYNNQATTPVKVVNFDTGYAAQEAESVAFGGDTYTVDLSKLPALTNGNMVLEGWYTTADFSGAKVNNGDTFAETTTLYARWVNSPKVAISFDANGGNAGTLAHRYIYSGDVLTTAGLDGHPYAPIRPGYAFTGWYYNTTMTSPVQATDTFSRDTTVYAGWKKIVGDNIDGNNVSLFFNPNGGVLNTAGIEYVQGTLIDSYDIVIPTRTGYTFVGWFWDAHHQGRQLSINDDINGSVILYAGWSKDDGQHETGKVVRTITLDANGGEGLLQTSLQTKDLSVDLFDQVKQIPSRAGYEFVGWFADAQCTIPAALSRGDMIYPSGNHTFYAGWRALSVQDTTNFTVTLSVNGGIADSGTNSLPMFAMGNNLEYYQSLIILPTREGYVFTGWYYDATMTQPYQGELIMNTTTLYAGWQDSSTVAVSISGNGGSQSVYANYPNSTPLALTRHITLGAILDKDEMAKINFFRLGYVFTGWYYDAAGTKPVGIDTDVFATDTTIYAGWKKSDANNNNYGQQSLLILHANGGVANTGSIIYTTGTTIDGYSIKAPTREGYTFAGWYWDEVHQARPFENTECLAGTVTVYAGWIRDNGVAEITLDVDANGGVSGGDMTGFFVGETIRHYLEKNSYVMPIRDNYTFVGWYTSATGGYRITNDTVIHSAIKIYARWQLNSGIVVTLDVNGGVEGSGTSGIAGFVSGNTLSSCVIELPTRSGYNFAGWHRDSQCTVAYNDEPITANITLYAKWSGIPYNVTRIVGETSETSVEYGYYQFPTVTNSLGEEIIWFVGDTAKSLVYYFGGQQLLLKADLTVRGEYYKVLTSVNDAYTGGHTNVALRDFNLSTLTVTLTATAGTTGNSSATRSGFLMDKGISKLLIDLSCSDTLSLGSQSTVLHKAAEGTGVCDAKAQYAHYFAGAFSGNTFTQIIIGDNVKLSQYAFSNTNLTAEDMSTVILAGENVSLPNNLFAKDAIDESGYNLVITSITFGGGMGGAFLPLLWTTVILLLLWYVVTTYKRRQRQCADNAQD